jgi:hypothetical protein
MDSAPTIETQVTLAVALPYLLQWLKGKSGFPLMSYNSQALNRTFTALVAFCASLGIHITFNSIAGTLLISGLTLSTIVTALQHGAFQWMMQHGVYKMMIAPSLPGAVQASKRAEPDATILEPMVNEKGPAKDPAKP